MTGSSHRAMGLTDTDEPNSARDKALGQPEILQNILAQLPMKNIHGVARVFKLWKNTIVGFKDVRVKAWMHHEGDTSTEPAERWELIKLGALDLKKGAPPDSLKLAKEYTHRFIRAKALDVEESKSDQDAKTSVQQGQQAPAPSKVSRARKTRKTFTPAYLNPTFVVDSTSYLTSDGIFRRPKQLGCDHAIMPSEFHLKDFQQIQVWKAKILDSYLTLPPTTSAHIKLEYRVDDDTFEVSRMVETSQPLTIRRAFAAALAGPGVVKRVTTRGNSQRASWRDEDCLQDLIIQREITRRAPWSIISDFHVLILGVVFPDEQERATVEAHDLATKDAENDAEK